MKAHKLEKGAPTAEVLACLEEHGYAIVEGHASAETMARLNGDFDPLLDAVQAGTTAFLGKRTRRLNNLIPKSKACQELAMDPLIREVCDAVLLPYCGRYHLHVTSLSELLPGQGQQALHRDSLVYPVQLPSIPMVLGTIWALTDFTAENGGTRLVPGSHLWDPDRQAESYEVVTAEMPAGSVLIYTGNFLHGGGENRTDAPRRGMLLHYNLGWLRQEENQYLSVPPHEAAKLPVELRKLIGYDFGGSNLGFVEGGNPIELTDPSLPRDSDRGGDPDFLRGALTITPTFAPDAGLARKPASRGT